MLKYKHKLIYKVQGSIITTIALVNALNSMKYIHKPYVLACIHIYQVGYTRIHYSHTLPDATPYIA